MKVIVCGSREFSNPFAASLTIDARIAALPPGSEIIHGAARGADQHAAETAARHGHTATAYPADWDRFGKRAGIIRNLAMLDLVPDLVIAFWNGTSRGTAHTIAEAGKRGIPAEIVSV